MITGKITKISVPFFDLNDAAMEPVDYADSYSVPLSHNHNYKIDELVLSIFDNVPAWIGALFKLRNIIVKPFGLKTSFKKTITNVPDNRIGKFRILVESDNKIILGENDKHLNFRAIIQIINKGEDEKLVVSTLVHFNNLLGKLYFIPVKPFHKLIIPAIIKTVLSKKNI